jgi:hypothetical protein
MLGVWRTSSLLYDYFSMLGAMCLEVAKQFDSVVADLYMDEYLLVPDGKDQKRIFQLPKDTMALMAWLAHWIVCTHSGKVVQRHGKDCSKEKKGGLW